MTVVRRELPPSQGARVAGQAVAEVETRTLQSCLHHPGAARPREAHSALSIGARPMPYAATPWVSTRVIAAQRKPTSSRATAMMAIGARLPWPTRCR
jgi:hypothetical protein